MKLVNNNNAVYIENFRNIVGFTKLNFINIVGFTKLNFINIVS
jgi:hypothetical protein